METTQARALMAVVVVVVVGGVAASWPGRGSVPGPCPRPALRDRLLVCDGDDASVPLGDRAWLVGQKLDLNRTSAAALERISGIGPSLATKIIAAREERGGFDSLDDVDDVEGVGPKMLEKLGAVVEVGPR